MLAPKDPGVCREKVEYQAQGAPGHHPQSGGARHIESEQHEEVCRVVDQTPAILESRYFAYSAHQIPVSAAQAQRKAYRRLSRHVAVAAAWKESIRAPYQSSGKGFV